MLSVHPVLKKSVKRHVQGMVRWLLRLSRGQVVRGIGDRVMGRSVNALSRLHLLDEVKSVVEASLKSLERHGLSRQAILSVAPHNIRLYEYFVRRHLKHGAKFITSRDLYSVPSPDAGSPRVLLRHDIDYTPEQLYLFTDLEKALGVRSDIYVILDAKHYDIMPYVDTLRQLAHDGFVVGLHTLAPVHDDFYTVLRREVRAFTDIFGFPPRYFTIHGPPAFPERPHNWVAIREQFIGKIRSRMASFGFDGSHNLGGVDHWIEDSCLGGEFAYLSMSWIEKDAEPGRVLGILAHPDHWIAWPPRWRVNYDQVNEHPLLQEFVRDARGFIVQPHVVNRHP